MKNLIITNILLSIKHVKKFTKRFNIFNDYNNLNKVFKTKNDFIMNAITGLDGLEPTLNSIKFTKIF